MLICKLTKNKENDAQKEKETVANFWKLVDKKLAKNYVSSYLVIFVKNRSYLGMFKK